MADYNQDYYYETRRRRNPFWLLPVGLIAGVALGPLIYSNPHAIYDLRSRLQAAIVSVLPAYEQYVSVIMILILLIALIVFRRLVMKLWLWAGLALGIALWIPFGAHAMFYAPQIKDMFPKAEAQLTLIVAKNPQFTAARNLALENLPIPPEAIPSLADALAADQAGTAQKPN